jgi:hypothetical protein
VTHEGGRGSRWTVALRDNVNDVAGFDSKDNLELVDDVNMRYANIVLLFFVTACGDDSANADAATDVTVDQTRQCGSASHIVLCPEDASVDAEKCPLITQVPDPSDPGTVPPRVADSGYYVGCTFTADDEAIDIDGSCMVPQWSCVDTPGHWEQAWIPEHR